YKVKRDCKIKDILVNEGDTIDGNQTLVTLE
ncbi:MAG: acetyl-CoA carboxylase biotin carboxyl carrier protein subunit, partial [Paludibacteraceae bacterium]|nr:acetyl-CoA carboxylase biotin carboxyl carrier protein subunit [Paludibacteraceae bacterium]